MNKKEMKIVNAIMMSCAISWNKIWGEELDQPTRDKFKSYIKEYLISLESNPISVLQWDIICDETNNNKYDENASRIIVDFKNNPLYFESIVTEGLFGTIVNVTKIKGD